MDFDFFNSPRVVGFKIQNSKDKSKKTKVKKRSKVPLLGGVRGGFLKDKTIL
jgi:hypothetical protein